MTKWFASALAVLALAATAHAVDTVDITECGQVVLRGQTGVLQNDLTCGATVMRCRDYPEVVCNSFMDCPNRLGCNAAALFLARSATLDLNGHTITNDAQQFAIRCPYRGKCTVHGGAVACPASSSGLGIWSGSRVFARDLSFTGCLSGITAEKINATRVVASGGGTGFYGQHVRAYDVTATDNQSIGLAGVGTLRIRKARTERNGGGGVWARTYNIDGLESHDNGAAGLTTFVFQGRGGRGLVRNSSITQNAYQGAPMDILAPEPPRMDNVVCDWSGLWTDFNAPAGPGLGVCVQQ